MGTSYRVAIWGPGEVGGAVARAARLRDDVELVGAKVFSDHKHGADLGELVGLGPIGVTATTSAQEILALDADCVVVTPRADVLGARLDADVIALLESGKNVISTASYHDPAMPNWLSASRPAPSRLLQACRTGGTTLHGTGVHPTFMVERVAMTMARALAGVTHVRCVEAVDFSAAAGDMWGGLKRIGFGTDPSGLGPGKPLALFGDLYYGDLTGNVAHHLYGSAVLRNRLTFDLGPAGAGTGRTNPVTGASVQAILDALPAVCAADPGILIDDPRPRYVHDDRIAAPAGPAS